MPPVFSAEVVVAWMWQWSKGRHQGGTGASLPSPLDLEGTVSGFPGLLDQKLWVMESKFVGSEIAVDGIKTWM